MTTGLIGRRIRALREVRKLSQEEVAKIFGFRDRQTVSAIETGARRVTAEELLLAVERLGAPLEYFTDPFLLAGKGTSPGDRAASTLLCSKPVSAAPGAGSPRSALLRRRSDTKHR